ncbi:MAG: acyltransferase family protein [Candidatus Korobacteraceae bacterium]
MVRKPDHIPTLDGWRAVAIIAVMVSHILLWSAVPASRVGRLLYWQIHTLGEKGVEVFFCLSGFLITSLLVREYQRYGRINIRAFYVRRAARILPAALTYLAVVSIVGSIGLIPVSHREIVASVAFFRNYAPTESCWFADHFWSLSVEEHFYLIWPGILAISRIRARWYAAAGIAIVVAWRAVNAPLMHTGFRLHTDARLDAILLGSLAALYCPQLKRRLKKIRHGLLLILAWYLISDVSMRHFAESFCRLSREGSVIAAIVFCLAHDGVWARVLEWFPLRWIGRLSYSLYLWQQFFLHISADRPGEVPVRVCMAVGCAYLSYRIIETPVIRMGHLWSSRLYRGAPYLSTRPPVSVVLTGREADALPPK